MIRLFMIWKDVGGSMGIGSGKNTRRLGLIS